MKNSNKTYMQYNNQDESAFAFKAKNTTSGQALTYKESPSVQGCHVNPPSPRALRNPLPPGARERASEFMPRPSLPRRVSMRGIGAARGFTLIELLVVVLIIGILAAVALPQYNKAVNKARGTEALNAIYALDQALTDYYLAHGTYEGANADTLNIKIPDLNYFEYMGVGAISNTPHFQVGCFVDSTEYRVSIITEGIETDHVWEYGNLTESICKYSNTLCEKYFNCHWKQVGSQTQCWLLL